MDSMEHACSWRLYARKQANNNTIQIRSRNQANEHNCERDYEVKHLSSRFIAEEFLHLFFDDAGLKWMQAILIYKYPNLNSCHAQCK